MSLFTVTPGGHLILLIMHFPMEREVLLNAFRDAFRNAHPALEIPTVTSWEQVNTHISALPSGSVVIVDDYFAFVHEKPRDAQEVWRLLAQFNRLEDVHTILHLHTPGDLVFPEFERRLWNNPNDFRDLIDSIWRSFDE